MSIFYSTNPNDWAALDGIYIDEVTPPPSVVGVPTNVACIVGQFERGSTAMQSVGSPGDLYELYGNNLNYSGPVALQNKKFGALNVVRVVASSGGAAATHSFLNASSSSAIVFTALWEGAYGNNLQVTIAAGTTTGSKYTVHDGNPNAVFPDEVYDNVVITGIAASNPFAVSNLIVGTPMRTNQGEPATISATSLSSGSDGSIADTDYQTAIALTQVDNSCNVLFLDSYNSARNGYLKTSMAATEDKMAIVAGRQRRLGCHGDHGRCELPRYRWSFDLRLPMGQHTDWQFADGCQSGKLLRCSDFSGGAEHRSGLCR